MNTARKKPKEVFDVDDEEAWAALNEAEGLEPSVQREKPKKKWIPEGMQPMLEEHPKWSLLAEVLQEIEDEIVRMEATNHISQLCRLIPLPVNC